MEVREQFFRLTFLALVFFLGHSFAPAQEGSGTGIGTTKVMSQPYRTEEDDTKGSVVRGRVYYQNTGKPLRRGWIGFHKIRELAEPNPDDKTGKIAVVSRSWGNEKYVLTNDAGEFVMKGVKSGIYQPIAKVQGVLNPGFNEENPNFQQITIDGVSEIQTNIGVQRGGAISGRVLYADGEPVIGARMQILIKRDSRYTPQSSDRNSFNSSITDDRGFYRFTALPANEYVIFVIEPSVQNDSGSGTTNSNISPFNTDSELKTFYPNVADVKEARTINIIPEQEQVDTNITVPDHRLFKISGTVVAKNNNLPLKNLRVSFQKINDGAIMNFGNNQARQTATDTQGNWTLIDLPAGKYRVTAASNDVSENYDNQPKATDNQPKYAPNTKEIEIDNDNLTNVSFELSTQATISGTITVENDKPLPDYVFLGAFDVENKISSSASLNNQNNKENQAQKPNNKFRIEKLPAGKFYLTGLPNGKYFVKSITLGNKDVKNNPVEIKDGENIEGVQVVLSSDFGIVKGKINNYKNGGRNAVVLLPTGKSPLLAIRSIGGESVPKPNGEFELNAAPGEYFAIIGTDANRPKTEADLENWFKELTKDAPRITVKAGETTNINLDYPM